MTKCVRHFIEHSWHEISYVMFDIQEEDRPYFCYLTVTIYHFFSLKFCPYLCTPLLLGYLQPQVSSSNTWFVEVSLLVSEL